MRVMLIALLLFLVAGCATVSPPVEPPPVPAPTTKTFTVHVTDAQGVGLVGALASLAIGQRWESDTILVSPELLVAATDANGRAFFSAVPWDTRQVQLTVTADGFEPRSQSILIADQLNTDWPPIVLDRIVPLLPRLLVEGRRFVTAPRGPPFIWKGLTAFRLVELVASGREADADRFLAWAAAHDVTVVRVFAMCWNLFRLDPERGRAALPAVLQLAAKHGVYVEVVLLVDTAAYTFDHLVHVAEIGVILGEHANALGEIANEPRHATQDSRLADPRYLEALRKLIPASVSVALGAAHGPDDESRDFIGGDFVTVHGDRSDGDAGWRFVRHTNEQRVISEAEDKFVVNDEPRRDDLDPDKHLALAILCRMHGLGDTYHYGGGLHAKVPEGAELAAFEARRRGWNAIPADFVGRYQNAGFADSPVEHFALAVRAYSSVRAGDGYTLVFGIGRGGPQIGWSPRWPGRELVLQDGATQFYRVSR